MLWMYIRIASRDSNTHPKHMILWITNDNKGKNTGLL